MSDIPKVLILAGGRGTRLSSVTNGMPKSLVSVDGKPFLELQLNWLESVGVKEVGILAGYGAKFIKEYVAIRNQKKLRVDVIVEEFELGTGGAILNSVSEYIEFGESFVVLNGDSMVDVDLQKFCSVGMAKEKCLQIGVGKVSKSEDYGFIVCDKNHAVVLFDEKSSENKSGFVNAGLYYFSANFINYADMHRTYPTSLEKNLIPDWLSEGRILSCYEIEGEFVDIGTPERLMKFTQISSVGGVVQ